MRDELAACRHHAVPRTQADLTDNRGQLTCLDIPAGGNRCERFRRPKAKNAGRMIRLGSNAFTKHHARENARCLSQKQKKSATTRTHAQEVEGIPDPAHAATRETVRWLEHILAEAGRKRAASRAVTPTQACKRTSTKEVPERVIDRYTFMKKKSNTRTGERKNSLRCANIFRFGHSITSVVMLINAFY